MIENPPTATQWVHDPKVLRAVAHPVRNRILTELTASGSMRAADVARELDIPANQASFHLRQLAKYGLVEEDTDAGRDRRDRVWRPVAELGVSIDLGAIEAEPGGRAAGAVFRRNAAAWGHMIVNRAYDDVREPETVRSITEQAIKLTKDEATELNAELDEVIARWTARTRGRDPGRRTYLFFSVVQPYPESGPKV